MGKMADRIKERFGSHSHGGRGGGESCGTREDSNRESSIMHALAAAVFSPKVDDWKMSRVLRHDVAEMMTILR